MEFVDGQTLREKIHLQRTELSKLLRYLQHVAEGLAKTHASGTATNVKPGTVVWAPPFRQHSVENVGDTEIRVISVELKD